MKTKTKTYPPKAPRALADFPPFMYAAASAALNPLCGEAAEKLPRALADFTPNKKARESQLAGLFVDLAGTLSGGGR